jgi:ABC-2 type transport system ATP-binding protein
MPPVLEVRDLVKRYGGLTAVDGVGFSVAPGTCFGLLGPNGAGKTTTIEVSEGIIPPTAGEVLYRGKPRDGAFHQEIGIQFQHTALFDFLTVAETLDIFRRLYEQPDDPERLMTLCSLQGIRKQRNDRISGGQRQRLLLALALVNRPRLLFLDEPSTGLDPQARRELWDIVGRIKAAGKTIILTTHYMEEAQHLCDIIAIMDQGRIIAQDTPDELIRRHARGVTVVLPEASLKDLSETDLPAGIHRVRDRIEIHTENVNDCLKRLMDHGVDLTDMSVRSSNLEDVFLTLTGRRLRD